MYFFALKMLLGNRSKYIMLISAISFCTLLITQQTSVFAGLMRWTTATLQNTQSPVWVMDPKVEQVNEVKPMRDTDLARVRSVQGVAWAVPFYFSLQQARLYNGHFKSIQLFGLDTATLMGAPPTLIEGNLQDLWQDKAVIVDEVGLAKLNEGSENPLKVGDSFDINDHEARIVGICTAARSFFGYPFVYTTYERAIQMAPKTRRNLSFILVQPATDWTPEAVSQEIQDRTGLKAVTEKKFFWETIWWFIKNTGIPISFGTTILLGFIVGITVSGQTFYSFILENLGNLGALKAMGASNGLICRMLIIQALFAGLTGYGIGVGLASIFGFITLKTGQPPFFMPYQILLGTLTCVLLICVLAAYIGIRRISRLEPAEVFRA
jgi:putative ABC transport system permease protein